MHYINFGNMFGLQTRSFSEYHLLCQRENKVKSQKGVDPPDMLPIREGTHRIAQDPGLGLSNQTKPPQCSALPLSR